MQVIKRIDPNDSYHKGNFFLFPQILYLYEMIDAH